MKNSKLVFLLFSILPFTSKGFDGRREVKKIGAYKIILSQDYASGLGKIVITKKKKKVFDESDIDNHYYFGNQFDEKKSNLSFRHDLTGKGIPNLIVSNWTGGAHCCNFLHIFELGKKFRKVATVAAGSSGIRFIDLDHDGFPEIEFWDGAIDYQFASFAFSPAGRVVLKFKNDQYEVATNLMNKPPLSIKRYKNAVKKSRLEFSKNESPDLPYNFLETMMNLSYSGHYQQALKFASDAWPKDKSGLEKFKDEFSQALKESLYWRDF